MTVYAEYAFLENFLLDAELLYLALKCARGRVRVWQLLLAAAVGAGEALVFPLLPLPVWAAYLVKFLGGALIAVLAVSKGTKKTYFVVLAAFFLITFALGGLLTAAYSFFNVSYAEGSGYLVEQAPVGLILGLAGGFGILIAVGAKRFYRYRCEKRAIFFCRLTAGKRTVNWKGFADSGNLLTFRGEPVCVASAAAVFALFGAHPKEEGRIRVGTVNGGRDSPVFRCDELEVGGKTAHGVYITVGEVASKEYSIILHSALLEGKHETFEHSENLAEPHPGQRKRRSLSLRK